MVDLDSITLETQGIMTRGDRKIVNIEATFREVAEMGIMKRAVKTRARGRALISVGFVNTTLDKVKGVDIQRYTKVESFEIIDSNKSKKTAEIIVIVE